MASAAQQSVENLGVAIHHVVKINAPIAVAWESLVESLQEMENPNGPMPMKLEQWPGGRWFRDLGNNNGHCWAMVQSIKKPTLLEFAGPLMLSTGAFSNVQYRLAEEGGVTTLTFQHLSSGPVTEEIRSGMEDGWGQISGRIKSRAESKKK
jgi:uncharacterized protein YndB with AHSA1/START domain